MRYILFSFPTVACSSSPSSASGVVNVQIPSVPIVDSKLNFSCSGSGDGQMRISTCGNDGQWKPDPENVMCPTVGELMCAATVACYFVIT